MTESAIRTIGMIGLDTSHVIAFTRLLHDTAAINHVSGWRVSHAWPGGTKGWAMSIDRVPGFTKELVESHDVTICETPEAVAEVVDLVLITAVDGRVHRELLERVLPAGKPVFVDKPFATSVDDAATMVAMAKAAGVPLMSCSSLRFSGALVDACQTVGRENIQAMSVFGPLRFDSQSPGLFWYGCHAIEVIVSVMGIGIERVRVVEGEHECTFVLDYPDGRRAMYHGLSDVAHSKFGAVLHGPEGAAFADISGHDVPFYADLLRAIVQSLPTGICTVPGDEMIEVVRLIEACNQAIEQDQAAMAM